MMVSLSKDALVGIFGAVFMLAGCTSDLTRSRFDPQPKERGDTRQEDARGEDGRDDDTRPVDVYAGEDGVGDGVGDGVEEDAVEDAPVGALTFTFKNRTARTFYTYPAPAACQSERGWLSLTINGEHIAPEPACAGCECGGTDCEPCDDRCASDLLGATPLAAGAERRYVWDKEVWSFDAANTCSTRALAVGDEVVAQFCWGHQLDADNAAEISDHRCESRSVALTDQAQAVVFEVDQGQLDWQVGDVLMSENDWLETRVGDMPLVISAPHGGRVQPAGVSTRTCGSRPVTVADTNSGDLAIAFAQRLESEYDLRPSLVVAHVKRAAVDLNRNIDLGACGNAAMEDVWRQYHADIETALARAIDEFGYAIYIDLHGHGHTKQRLELGYGLNKGSIQAVYEDPSEAERLGPRSSLRNLLSMTDLSFQDALTGDVAFGTLIHAAGIPAVPSQQDPFPAGSDKYFSGGFNTRRYTASAYSRVFGWQIETHRDARWGGSDGGAAGRQAFARAFADVITEYIEYVEAHIDG